MNLKNTRHKVISACLVLAISSSATNVALSMLGDTFNTINDRVDSVAGLAQTPSRALIVGENAEETGEAGEAGETGIVQPALKPILSLGIEPWATNRDVSTVIILNAAGIAPQGCSEVSVVGANVGANNEFTNNEFTSNENRDTEINNTEITANHISSEAFNNEDFISIDFNDAEALEESLYTDNAEGTFVNAVTGEARAVITKLLGKHRVLADTGKLNSAIGSRQSSLYKGEILSLLRIGSLSGEVMHSSTIASSDQVYSSASLGDLVLDILDSTSVAVDFVSSRARALAGGENSGYTDIAGLSISGIPVYVNGEINQVVPLFDDSLVPMEIGRIIINEQEAIPGGIRVNAIRVIVDGVGEIVIASSTAGLVQAG